MVMLGEAKLFDDCWFIAIQLKCLLLLLIEKRSAKVRIKVEAGRISNPLFLSSHERRNRLVESGLRGDWQ